MSLRHHEHCCTAQASVFLSHAIANFLDMRHLGICPAVDLLQ